MTGPRILDVLWISPERAAIKAGGSDGVRYRIVSRVEGEQIAAGLANESRESVDSEPSPRS